ncbi:MAG: DUF6371 domain-containing protein [Pyrinomonadaceae bacterium]
MIQLEKYHGTKSRHACPNCNSKGVFVRYQNESGEYLSFDVGRCNRESKCGYHYKPKQYFADNPSSSKFVKTRAGKSQQIKTQTLTEKPKSFDYIAPEHLKATLSHYDRNAFVQFLFDLFPDCSEEIQDVLKMYFVGTYEDYTCFPQIDRLNRICKAKLIKFNPATGRRLKGKFDTSSLVRKLKLKEDFNYKQIFFGEHLLPKYPNKPVAVVESEKSAIIASLCFPEFIWLGSNSKTWLKTERLKRLGKRQIILYPDADGFEFWQSIAREAQRQGSTIKISNLIESHATSEQKANGYDLADYLINQQKEINQTNSKLETVLNDESLRSDFEMILDEQKAVAVYNGLSENEAEILCRQPENVRTVVMSV